MCLFGFSLVITFCKDTTHSPKTTNSDAYHRDTLLVRLDLGEGTLSPSRVPRYVHKTASQHASLG